MGLSWFPAIGKYDNSAWSQLSDSSQFMDDRRRKDVATVTQIEWLSKTNQRKEALEMVTEFFKTRYTRDWDDIYGRIVTMATSLSIEFMVCIPGFIGSLVQMADRAFGDVLTRLCLKYLEDCRVRISDEQQIEALSRRLIERYIPKPWGDGVFTDRAFEYLVTVYMDFLTNLRPKTHRHKLYHAVLEKGYQIADEFESLHFYDLLSSEIDKVASDKKAPIEFQRSVLKTLFARYQTAVNISRYSRAFRTLTIANEFIQSHTAPMDLHENLEVKKTVLLQIREDRLPAAVQMMKLVEFYDTTPIDPPMPVQYLRDLALMTALAAPLVDGNYASFKRLIRDDVPPRQYLVSKLLGESRNSSLRQFGIAAEEARDAKSICLSFQSFLGEFGKAFKLPVLYRALGTYAAVRIIQAAAAQQDAVPLEMFSHMIKWMTEFEIHAAISKAITLGLVRGRIDMKLGSLRLHNKG